METIMLSTPWPNAWNTDPETIPKPAKIKQVQMIRRAGTPMASISSEASKSPRSWAGNNSATASPASITHTAVMTASFMVSKILCRFFAP